jgi:hypothetical protein
MPSDVTNIPTFLFVHLGIILILVLGFYSGLSSRVRAVYLFSVSVVSLLSSRFTASALVSFSNFLKCLVFHFYISLSSGACGCLCTKVRTPHPALSRRGSPDLTYSTALLVNRPLINNSCGRGTSNTPH